METTNQKEAEKANAIYEDDDGYFNDFEMMVGSERLNSEDWEERQKSFDQTGSGNIRKSTEEFLKMKRDEFWESHKESIEETRMINQLAEYHEQLQLIRKMEQEQKAEELRQQKQYQQQQQLLRKQQAFKAQQQQQQQQQTQNQPNIQQLQQLMANIQNALQQLQVQYAQHQQKIQQQFEPVVVSLTNAMQNAKQENNSQKMQQLQIQQAQTEQEFQKQIAMLQQQFAPQIQQLQLNAANVQQAYQQQLHQQQLHQQQQLNQQQLHQSSQIKKKDRDIPVFIPSQQSNTNNKMDTIQENQVPIINQNEKQSAPFIVDEHDVNIEDDAKLNRRTSRGDNDEVLNGDNDNANIIIKDQLNRNETIINRDENMSRSNSNLSHKSGKTVSDKTNNKQRVTSQSITSQKSNNSITKSPVTTIASNMISPSISPMKLSHSAHTSPVTMPTNNMTQHRVPNLSFNSQLPPTINTSSNNNNSNCNNTPPNSLPTTPIPGLPSLADISRTPELKPQGQKKKKRKKTKRGINSNDGIRSLPNSPFNASTKKLKPKMNINAKSNPMGPMSDNILSPLILNEQTNNGNCNNPYKHINDHPLMINNNNNNNNNNREISDSQKSHSTTIRNEEKDDEEEDDDDGLSSSSSSESEEEEEDDDEKSMRSIMTQSDRMTSRSRKDSNNSMYSYSSMSTVFTGVHDGNLLANNSVYLSKMSNEQYNKMEVVNDIKSLWLQVFSIPLLFTIMTTIIICWLSRYSHNNTNNELGGLLLGITIFNMIGHLAIKGMTSTLSSVCDQVYSANCKPLVGIQLQRMMGFSIIITMPFVMITMQGFAYSMDMFSQPKDTLIYMHQLIDYSMFIIPPLTMFYVFQRYLQGSHVLHVNGYVAVCLIVSIAIELALLTIYQNVNSFKQKTDIYTIIIISYIVGYFILFIAFTAAINIYKLHSETFIFKTTIKHLLSVRKWCKYLNNGIYRTALLFCNYWYFDFMIIMAGVQGLHQLIAFGILCNIYHIICSIISASEFVAKSLIFRGLLHSSIEYAKDAWKYTTFFGFFLSVIIGGVFFLLRENISKCCTKNENIQQLMNNSWLYLYILIICNGIKYGLVGGAQAMGYVKLVSSINLFSFYIITIPVSVWCATLYKDQLSGLHPIYLSILLGNIICIISLLIFRIYINWNRELQLFTLRAHNQAQSMQKSVEAVHIQLQHYKSQIYHHRHPQNYHHHHHHHHKHHHKHHKKSKHHKHHKKSKHNKYKSSHHHHHQHQHQHQHQRKHWMNKIPLQQQSQIGSTTFGATSINSSSNSFGRMNVMPLNRQRTNETLGTINSATTTRTTTCLQCSLDIPNCKCIIHRYGEPQQPQHQHQYLKTHRVRHDLKQYKQQNIRKRRTIWHDLFDALKKYCCCCLFDGCCCDCRGGCCQEWWYYFCGCCCSDSYLRDDYNHHSIQQQQQQQAQHGGYNMYAPHQSFNPRRATHDTHSSTPYSNYALDLNNSKYEIIQNEYDDGGAIKLEINDNHHNNNNNELKHSLISNNSFAGAGADYLKHSVSQFDPNGNQYMMRS